MKKLAALVAATTLNIGIAVLLSMTPTVAADGTRASTP